MSNNDRDGDARGHFHAARGRGGPAHGSPGRTRIPSPQRRNDEFRSAVTSMAIMIAEHRGLEQRQIPQTGRSFPRVEAEIYEALGPVIGDSWQEELEKAMYDELFAADDPVDDDDDGKDGAGQQVAASPVDNSADDLPNPDAELEQTVAALRGDPLIHRPEERNNPILDRRLPGSTDAGFRPNLGDIILRITPPADGNGVEYYTGGGANEAATSLQAGDKIVRIFYDNVSTRGVTVTYAELHLCIGNQGPPEIPEFLYFGRALQRMADV